MSKIQKTILFIFSFSQTILASQQIQKTLSNGEVNKINTRSIPVSLNDNDEKEGEDKVDEEVGVVHAEIISLFSKEQVLVQSPDMREFMDLVEGEFFVDGRFSMEELYWLLSIMRDYLKVFEEQMGGDELLNKFQDDLGGKLFL